MPLLRWLASVLRASLWLVVNLGIATAAFAASAAMFAQGDEDLRVPATLLRTVGAFWLYIAAWTWVVRGVFMRPPPPVRPQTSKVSGQQAARGAAGCAANMVAVGVVWVFAGRLADAAWAGYHGGGPAHPARRLADRAMVLLQAVAAQPEYYVPRVLGGVAALLVLNGVLTRLARPPAPRSSRQKSGQESGGRQSRGKAPAGAAPDQIPTRAGAAVEKSHGGAHRSGAARRSSREDAVLGTLRYAASDNGWWARQGSDQFPVRIDADADGPSSTQLDLARALVQRAFEAQLRGADAARTLAQARGIGLPRFTIAAASVGPDAGAATPVTLHLRCDGDPQHQYAVRSTNALHSFAPA